MGHNVSRCVDPAVAGLAIAGWAIGSPYWIFATTNAATIAAMIWRHALRVTLVSLAAERGASAVQARLRQAFARHYDTSRGSGGCSCWTKWPRTRMGPCLLPFEISLAATMPSEILAAVE